MTQRTLTIERPVEADFVAVVNLLHAEGLCTSDLTPAHLENFRVLRGGGRVVGCVGLEVYGAHALLRSLAVEKGERGTGRGADLVACIEQDAAALGVKTVFLLTETAESFFAGHGYDAISKSSLPEAVAASPEVTTLCPESAVAMRKVLGGEREEALALHRALTELIRVLRFRDAERVCCHDISVTQSHVLDRLANEGPTAPNDLAAMLFLEKSSVSRIVGGLEKKGYVKRKPHPDDKRANLLALTAKGRTLHDRIEKDLLEEESRMLDGLGPDARQTLTVAVERLARSASARVDVSGGKCELR